MESTTTTAVTASTTVPIIAKHDEQRLARYIRESCPPVSVSELRRYAERFLGRAIDAEAWEEFCFRRLGMGC